MFKPKSIYQQVVYNTLLSACIPLIILSIVLCYFVYQKNESDLMRETETATKEYVRSVQKVIEDVHQRSDYILQSEYITEKLNEKFERNTDRLLLSNHLWEYIGVFDAEHNGENAFRIYTSNQTVYEDKYIWNISRLDGATEILDKLKNNLTNLVWKDEIVQDETNGSYFVFYRRIMTENESVLACRVYIPELPEKMCIRSLSGNQKGDCGENVIEIPVNDFFSVTVEHDSQAARREVLNVLLLFIGFLGFALLLTSLVAKRIAGKMTHNITAFVQEINDERLLELDEKNFCGETELEEMKIIKKAILQLLSEIQRISTLKQDVELEKKDMEVSLLQKQLDPHTLYNSLSAIKYNAFVRKDTDTIAIVDHMTSYYRAVLNKGKDYVKLSDELEAMRKYVEINTLSRAIDYKLSVSVEQGLENCTVIHLLLLPFIENAIIHGFDGSQEECRISIDCRRDGSFIVIVVEDNGFGIENEKLKRINNLEVYEGSFGIKNSYRRLRLVHGENSSIAFESEQGKGTRVTIRFEYDFEKSENEPI